MYYYLLLIIILCVDIPLLFLDYYFYYYLQEEARKMVTDNLPRRPQAQQKGKPKPNAGNRIAIRRGDKASKEKEALLVEHTHFHLARCTKTNESEVAAIPIAQQ